MLMQKSLYIKIIIKLIILNEIVFNLIKKPFEYML